MFLENDEYDIVAAESFYLRAKSNSPDDPRVLYDLADFYYAKQHDTKKALPLLLRVVQIEPSNAVALGLLAIVHEELGDLVNAEKCYMRALDLDAQSPVRLYNYAFFLEQHKGDYNKAKLFYNKAIAIRPDYDAALFNLGDLLETMEDAVGAEEVYRRLLQMHPNHVNGLSNLAQLIMQQRRFEQADSLFVRVLQIEPDNLTALCNYGQLLYQWKRDSARSIEMYTRMLRIDPKHSHAYCCMGQCSSDQLVALGYFEKSIEYNPHNHVALFHCGRLLFMLNPQDPRAIQLLERAHIANGHQVEEIKTVLRQARAFVNSSASTGFPNRPPQPPVTSSSVDGFAPCQQLKDEGNALFKAKNFEAAILRYVRALLLLVKEAQSAKVQDLRLSLNLNLAACHTARLSWTNVIMYCNKALEANPHSAKAYYRRAIANEATDKLLLALEDIKKSRQLSVGAVDTAVLEALTRIEKAVMNGLTATAGDISLDPRIPRTHSVVYGNDLTLNRTHNHRYVVGVIISDAFSMAGIHFNIEDDQGTTIAMSLYNYDGVSHAKVRYFASSSEKHFRTEECVKLGLKKGQRICILNPFYKQRMDGTLGIRVDNKNEVILL